MNKTKVRVWDLPTRLFHWTLASLIVASFVTIKTGETQIHFYCGYAILALLLFRLIWGFAGGRYARFASFLFGPGAIWRYLRNHPAQPHTLGHNPLGSLSVWGLLAVVGFQAVSGLFSNDDIASEGPLARHISSAASSFITSLHHANETIILILVGLHIAAVIGYLLFKRENLISPMVVGDKAIEPTVSTTRAAAPGSGTSASANDRENLAHPLASRDDGGLRWRAMVVLALCVVIVWGVVR